MTTPVRIVIAPHGDGTEVYLDGVRVQNVRRIMLGHVEPGKPTTLTLEILVDHAIVDGEVAEVKTGEEPKAKRLKV
jgi:hypothetical protein